MTPTTFPTPAVASAGGEDPAAPLVVLLHGRGSSETEILPLAAHLPTGPQGTAAPIGDI